MGDLLYTQDDSELDDQIEEYQDQITEQENQLDDYQEQLAQLQEEIAALTVTAPFAGRITDVAVDVGDNVVCTPSSGQRNNLHLRMKILPAHHMVLGTMQPADGHGLP